MDIDLLSKIVKELIMEADEVPLPGVGSFVADTEPATFSDKGYTINPPYRRLSFRQRIEGNDSAVIDFYAKTNNIPPEQAAPIVSAFLIELKEVLKQKKVVIFPGLGRLRATKENNFFFVADEDLDIYPQGFGLEPVSLKTHRESPEEVSDTIRKLGAIITPENDVSPEPDVTPEPVAEAAAPEAQEPEATAGPETFAMPEGEPVEENEPVEEEETPSAQEPEMVIEDLEPIPEPTEEMPEVEEIPEAGTEALEEAVLPEGEEKHGFRWWKALLVIVAVIAVLILAYAVLARIFPDFFDTLLYTKEELQIIYHR